MALAFAKTFGKEYKDFESDLEETRDKIRRMKKQLDLVNKYLKGAIDV